MCIFISIFIWFTLFLYVHWKDLESIHKFIWNILPSQGPSYPDLHAPNPMALAELSPPPESLDGAKAVVDDENEDEEEDKMEVFTLKQIA